MRRLRLLLFATLAAAYGLLGCGVSSDDGATGGSSAEGGDAGARDAGGEGDGAGAMNSGAGGTNGQGGANSGGFAETGGGGAPTGTGGASGIGAPGETGRMVGMTAAHNAERALVGDGLPPVEWDSEIAAVAQRHAEQLASTSCRLEHSDTSYGENLYIAGTNNPAGPNPIPEDVVTSWASEKACYTYGTFLESDACSAACAESGCGHYTQIVWESTRSIGCGFATCSRDGFLIEIWVCNYDPPGNYVGELPY